MKKGQSYYYKIVPKHLNKKVGSLIDTEHTWCPKRIEIQRNQYNFFQSLVNHSNNFDLPIMSILNQLKYYSFNWSLKKQNRELKKLYSLLKKSKSRYEFNTFHFVDFVLEKTRCEINSVDKKSLPNRFHSNFFFNSILDCKLYFKELNDSIPSEIFKIEIIETSEIDMFDNRLINNFPEDFTAHNYYSKIHNFLNKQVSSTPRFETVFIGKYKLVERIEL